MAAIAKFITYDGGIAFSDSVVKIQKRAGESRIIPMEEVDSVGVRQPQQDTDGFVRVQTADGKRYRIFFEAGQLKEAVQFKRQFDSTAAAYRDSAASAPAPERSRPSKPTIKYDAAGLEDYPAPPERNVGGIVWAVALSLLALIAIALGVMVFLKVRQASTADVGYLTGLRAAARLTRL